MDDGNSDIISLRRLVKDLRRNCGLFTRENYVCFDGLPYDYEAVQQKEMMERAGKGAFWAERSGPRAHVISRMAHQQFDKLAGIDPAKRSREDRLPASLLTTIEKWLNDSGADDLAKWSHAYLAHAGGPESRKRIADLMVTTNKITDAIKALARVTEAISPWLLFAGGRTNALMPVAQFNPFEKLDKPIMQAGAEADAYKLWHQLSDERNRYLDGVDAELIGRAEVGRPVIMKYPVARFKSLAVALKKIEPFIRNGEHLQTGKPFAKFGGMRSREILANWLLCAAMNSASVGELTFSSDPIGGDGIICDVRDGRDLADRARHGAEVSRRSSRGCRRAYLESNRAKTPQRRRGVRCWQNTDRVFECRGGELAPEQSRAAIA